MTPWLIVAGDFTPLGGMDAANHALARHLARRAELHLVTHRAWPDLEASQSVVVHRVPRPFNRHALGSALLSRAGERVARRLRHRGVRVVVNGGNCRASGTNWVHYVHAAYTPLVAGSLARRSKTMFVHQRDVAAEQAALRAAALVVCNSRRTRDDVVERVGVDPARASVVYYGTDAERLAPVSETARDAAKASYGFERGRPLFGFVGALGDRRKAFDTLFAAWSDLCRDRRWEADLLVVGTGRELAFWRRRADVEGIGHRIHFTGFRRDVPELLAALDVFVHPARYEAYGLAPHEAICRGVPALVSVSAGVAERYPSGLADLLINDADDAGELRDRLMMACRERERFQPAISKLSETFRARTWDAMALEIASAAEART